MSFDRGRFESLLDRCGTLLGELWAVDQCLHAWKDLGQRADDGDFGGWMAVKRTRDVSIGRTHPFTLYNQPEANTALYGGGLDTGGPSAGPTFPSMPEIKPFEAFYQEGTSWGADIAHAVRGQVEDVVRPISAEFEAAYDVVHEQIATVALGLPDDFGGLTNNLAHWRGTSADAFADWYAEVEHIARRQAALAEFLGADIAAAKAIVDLGQQSLMQFLGDLERNLDTALKTRADAQAPEPPSDFPWLELSIFALSIVTALPSGGASLAAGAVSLASTSAATLSFAASVVPPEAGDVVTFTVNTADDMFTRLSGGLDDLGQQLRAQWEGLAQAAQEQLTQAAGLAESGDCFPRRPGSIDHPTPDGFHHDSAPR